MYRPGYPQWPGIGLGAVIMVIDCTCDDLDIRAVEVDDEVDGMV